MSTISGKASPFSSSNGPKEILLKSYLVSTCKKLSKKRVAFHIINRVVVRILQWINKTYPKPLKS